MIDFLFTNKWGPFIVLLLFHIPFFIVFFHIVNKKAFDDPEPSNTPPEKYSKYRYGWIALVVGVFIVINVGSIGYMPTVVEANATDPNIRNVDVTAKSWSLNS